jgi:lactoylglutathione lyase
MGGCVMNLGAFSVSLAVKDLNASLAFYEKLGFAPFGGDAAQGWLILKSPTAVIGLFQGMFEKNIMTFNPGWDADKQEVPGFTDIRSIQSVIEAAGLTPELRADPGTTGPAYVTLTDPDGNAILIDQHV